MLDAMEDWKGAISTATLNSLVTSSNATRDYTNSLTEHWANWSVATAGKAGEAPTTPQASMVDSIIGILNPFDTVNAAEMVAPNSQANATPGSRRPNPSEINVVYSIYGIVSEHTPEEWEVIREHQNRDWSIRRWFVDDEQKRMKDAGFKMSFRHLDEGAPPPTIPPLQYFPRGLRYRRRHLRQQNNRVIMRSQFQTANLSRDWASQTPLLESLAALAGTTSIKPSTSCTVLGTTCLLASAGGYVPLSLTTKLTTEAVRITLVAGWALSQI